MLDQRKCLHACRVICASLFLISGFAAAQPYPTKPIRLVVPLAAGGGGDIMARLIGQKISEALGQAVIVDNRPGGATVIGTEIVARSAADGYTLLMATSSNALNVSLYKLPFDPIKDFSGVSLIGVSSLLLTLHPNVPAKSLKELIALAKARPGKLNYASSGNASVPHLSGELFDNMAGVKTVHIPYKGSGPALNDLIGGQVDMMFAGLLSVLPYIKSGRLRALAVTSEQRSPVMPEIPTMAEAGLPGFEASTFYAILGPAGMPRQVIARLNGEINKATQLPDIRERLQGLGIDIVSSTPEEALSYLQMLIMRWAKVIKEANIKAE